MNDDLVINEYFQGLMEQISKSGKELHHKVSEESLINFYATLSKEMLALTIAMIIKGTTLLQAHHEDIQLIVTSAIERAIELKQRLKDEP
jgi:hypothetical protein